MNVFKHSTRIALIILPVLTATEIILQVLGFGNPPLLIADSEMGYRFKPNQKTMCHNSL